MAILVNLACKTDCSPSPSEPISSFVGLLGSGISVPTPPGCLRSMALCEFPRMLPSSGSEMRKKNKINLESRFFFDDSQYDNCFPFSMVDINVVVLTSKGQFI